MTEDLIQGLQSFKKYHYDEETGLMPDLAFYGQDPKYFIISCIDSRCNPGTIFRAPPGIFLSHKAMGAIVRPYQSGTALSAALQFGIEYNKIESVIVLGHTNCGAIKALAEDIDDIEISSFVNVARHALTKAQKCCDTPAEIIARTEQEAVLESTENLKAYPSIAKALTEGRIEVKSWIFDMNKGNLLEYNEKTNRFDIRLAKNHVNDSRNTDA